MRGFSSIFIRKIGLGERSNIEWQRSRVNVHGHQEKQVKISNSSIFYPKRGFLVNPKLKFKVSHGASGVKVRGQGQGRQQRGEIGPKIAFSMVSEPKRGFLDKTNLC